MKLLQIGGKIDYIKMHFTDISEPFFSYISEKIIYLQTELNLLLLDAIKIIYDKHLDCTTIE